jgi:3-hydroxybutyryl-CoA dehydrogenase
VTTHGVHTVGIVGSGIMGAGLADVMATAGFAVVARSRSLGGATELRTTLETTTAKRVARGTASDEERDRTLERVTVTSDLGALHDCDVVLESIIEDLEVKRSLFAELDRLVKPGAILVTNTSTLPVIELAMATQRPELVCGLHFFNPAPVMRLVEVVRAVTTHDDTVATVVQVAQACGKDVVHVADRAGFVVNALLFPYLNHAVRLWEEGVASMDDIDTAMCGGCNFPMGPFALLDLVGLDTSVAILDALHAERRDSATVAAPSLRRLVAAGRLGRKSGQGFRTYGVAR